MAAQEKGLLPGSDSRFSKANRRAVACRRIHSKIAPRNFLVQCLTGNWSYFEQEKTEATETKTLFSLFPHVENTTIYLRDASLASKSQKETKAKGLNKKSARRRQSWEV